MATIPVPHDFIAGDDATSTIMQSLSDASHYTLGQTTSGGALRPLCRVRQTVVQSLANGTFTDITMDVEDVDYDNGHSTSTNTARYTAGTAGWYLVQGRVFFTANSTGTRGVRLAVSGTVRIATGVYIGANADATATGTGIQTSDFVFLNVNDYVTVQGFQRSTAALNTTASTSNEATSQLLVYLISQ